MSCFHEYRSLLGLCRWLGMRSDDIIIKGDIFEYVLVVGCFFTLQGINRIGDFVCVGK